MFFMLYKSVQTLRLRGIYIYKNIGSAILGDVYPSYDRFIFFGAKSCRAKSCNTCFNSFFSSLAISFVDVIATMLSKLLPWRLKSDTSRQGHISEGAIYEWYKLIACSTVAAGGSLVSNSCKG